MGSSKREGVPAHVNLSASSMLMIAMQYTSNPGMCKDSIIHSETTRQEVLSNAIRKVFIMGKNCGVIQHGMKNYLF